MGPLSGLKVLEFAGVGPIPMCAMLLADLGATVLRIDRREPSKLGRPRPFEYSLTLRNRNAIALDLKEPGSVELALTLAERSDALIEGFRPGVMERLGLGPDVCLARNKRLVYGRMTGWGQSGPLSNAAGHDINYIALAGVLNSIGRRNQMPTPPLNLVGDLGGGALYLAFGVMAALYECQQSHRGQVVDAAMVDGAASLATPLYGLSAAGMLGPRGTNPTDSGSHFYNTYECADGKLISVACVEHKFYIQLLKILELEAADLPQSEPDKWEHATKVIADRFKSRTRDEWCKLMEGTDACFAPVLSIEEAPTHPHLIARNTFVEINGVIQPAPAPRFSRSVPETPTAPERAEAHNISAALKDWLDPRQIDLWRQNGTLR